MAKLQCQNCGFTADESKFNPARDVAERHEMGDIFSDMECPKCRALAFPFAPPMKTEATHTPGPWKAGRSAVYDTVYQVEDGFETTNVICFLPISDKAKANARLIALAPRMLEALQHAERVLSRAAGECNDASLAYEALEIESILSEAEEVKP